MLISKFFQGARLTVSIGDAFGITLVALPFIALLPITLPVWVFMNAREHYRRYQNDKWLEKYYKDHPKI